MLEPVKRLAIAERVGRRAVIASVSGGRDSAAMSLHLRELGIEHDRVFVDTGWEHEKTYEYLRGELARVIGQITEIKGPFDFVSLARKKRDVSVAREAVLHRGIEGETDAEVRRAACRKR